MEVRDAPAGLSGDRRFWRHVIAPALLPRLRIKRDDYVVGTAQIQGVADIDWCHLEACLDGRVCRAGVSLPGDCKLLDVLRADVRQRAEAGASGVIPVL